MFNALPAVISASKVIAAPGITHDLHSDLADLEWICDVASGVGSVPETNGGDPLDYVDRSGGDTTLLTEDAGFRWNPLRNVFVPRDRSEGLTFNGDNELGSVTQAKGVAMRVIVKMPTAAPGGTPWDYLLQKFNDGSGTSSPDSYHWNGWILERHSTGIILAALEGSGYAQTLITVPLLAAGDTDYHQISFWIRYNGSTGFDMSLRVDQTEVTGFRSGSQMTAYRYPLLVNQRHIDANWGTTDAEYAYIGIAEGAGAQAFYEEDAPIPRLDPVVVGASLWEIPDYPHYLDDEFEDSVIDPAWDGAGGFDYVTPIDPYDAAVGAARVNIHGSHPSWLMHQNGIGLSKEFPGGLPTNCLIWARMRWTRDLSEANGESEVALWFGASSGGEYDGANQIGVYLSEWESGEHASGYYRNGGSFPRWGSETARMYNEGTALEYVAVHKIGLTFHGWVMGNGGNRFYLGSSTHPNGASMDRVGFHIVGAQTNPGDIGGGIDFFRVVETATFLP